MTIYFSTFDSCNLLAAIRDILQERQSLSLSVAFEHRETKLLMSPLAVYAEACSYELYLAAPTVRAVAETRKQLAPVSLILPHSSSKDQSWEQIVTKSLRPSPSATGLDLTWHQIVTESLRARASAPEPGIACIAEEFLGDIFDINVAKSEKKVCEVKSGKQGDVFVRDGYWAEHSSLSQPPYILKNPWRDTDERRKEQLKVYHCFIDQSVSAPGHVRVWDLDGRSGHLAMFVGGGLAVSGDGMSLVAPQSVCKSDRKTPIQDGWVIWYFATPAPAPELDIVTRELDEALAIELERRVEEERWLNPPSQLLEKAELNTGNATVFYMPEKTSLSEAERTEVVIEKSALDIFEAAYESLGGDLQPRHRTKECLSLFRLEGALESGCTPEELDHLTACPYCTRMASVFAAEVRAMQPKGDDVELQVRQSTASKKQSQY